MIGRSNAAFIILLEVSHIDDNARNKSRGDVRSQIYAVATLRPSVGQRAAVLADQTGIRGRTEIAALACGQPRATGDSCYSRKCRNRNWRQRRYTGTAAEFAALAGISRYADRNRHEGRRIVCTQLDVVGYCPVHSIFRVKRRGHVAIFVVTCRKSDLNFLYQWDVHVGRYDGDIDLAETRQDIALRTKY